MQRGMLFARKLRPEAGKPSTRGAGLAVGLALLLAVGLAAGPAGAPLAAEPSAAPGGVGADFVQGDLWALVVGINEYPSLPPAKQLKAARPGAEAVARLLRQYRVERDRLTQLFDDGATKDSILGHILGPLRRDVKEQDSVFFYFAGQCQVDPKTKEAGLLPAGAVEDVPTSFILVKELQDVLSRVPARHIFVAVDSCVGDFLVGGSKISGDPPVREVYQKKSRWVLAAGTPPQADGGLSPFAQALVDSLRENTLAYLTPLHLGQELATRLPPAANRTLKSGPMVGVGDEDGQFVFRLEGAPPPAEEIRVPSPEDPRIARVRWEIEQIQEMPLSSPLKERAVASLQGRLNDIRAEIEEQRRKLEAERQERIKQEAQARAEAERGEIAPPKPEDLAPMVLIPAGEFIMGSTPREGPSDEQPQRRIYLDAYHIDKYETTVGRYAKYLLASREKPPLHWELVKANGDGEFPVIGVDWDQANNYCQWAGKRLPTEAEWEKAARGTDGRKHPWGNEGPTPLLANLGRGGTFAYAKSLEKVGSFEPGKSPYGIYEMVGNVWEWVADWYDRRAYKDMAERNPKGPDKSSEKGAQRVIRGGSWERVPLVVRVAARHRAAPSTQNAYIGFRCAKDAR